MDKNKLEICKKNGYHTWQDMDGHMTIHFDSAIDDLERTEGQLECQICGSICELTGDWEEIEE